MKKRIRILMPALVTLAMLVSLFGMAIPVQGVDPIQFHGATILKTVVRTVDGAYQAREGDEVTATIRVINTDDFGCALVINEISDVVHHASGDVPTGNLLGAPVTLAAYGDYIDVSHTYTVEEGDNDPLTDAATCIGVDPVVGEFTLTYPGLIDIISPCIEIEKLVDCNDDEEYLHEDTGSYGDTPSWYIKVTNCGDSPLLNVMVSDTNGMSFGPFDLVNPGDFWETYYDGDPIFETTTNEATASATDVLGGAVGPVFDSATNLIVGNEGCTPGFWKNNADKHEASAWCLDYVTPEHLFDDVFGVDVTLRGKGKDTIENPTLLEALGANGGGINALARHATAALLNICNPNINYAGGMNVCALISAVQNAVAMNGDAIEALHTELAEHNEAGCSVNQHGEPIIPD